MFLDISQNSQENTCVRVSFLIKLQASACHVIKKETLAQLFSCEFCKISKNTFPYRKPPVAAFVESFYFISCAFPKKFVKQIFTFTEKAYFMDTKVFLFIILRYENKNNQQTKQENSAFNDVMAKRNLNINSTETKTNSLDFFIVDFEKLFVSNDIVDHVF